MIAVFVAELKRLHARQPPQEADWTRTHDCHWPLQHCARGPGGGGGGGEGGGGE